MKASTIIGLGALCGFLVVWMVTASSFLFRLVDFMKATNRNVGTALNTSEQWPFRQQQQLLSSVASNAASIYPSPLACTKDQLEIIYGRLAEFEENCANPSNPWTNACPISIETGCPDATWLEDYYVSQHEQNPTMKSFFLAINIGCNKGYDAVKFLRMGSNNPVFNRRAWKDAMPPTTQPGVCGQETESSMESASPASFVRGATTKALVYCIEPMPSTFLALQNASHTTGWENEFKVLQLAINNEDPSTVLFPKPEPDNLGFEKHTIGIGCHKAPNDCIPVETTKLDLMMRDEQLVDARVNVLLIDVEGFDFEVLQGGNSTLHNTEYVEFEFNWRGRWGSDFREGKKPLKSAITYLEEIGFTCYWAGRGELWRITDCWQPHYDGMFWSNVACANRRLVPALLQKMEALFLTTISTKLRPQFPIDVTSFQSHNEFRNDTISLCDATGNEQYQLTVVDRRFDGWTALMHPTCVWLDPPVSSKPDRREDLRAAAEGMDCIRLIAVDRRPPGIGDEIARRELYHFAMVIAQQGLYLRQRRLKAGRGIHFVSKESIMR